MNQEQIMEWLIEASSPDCTWERATEIQCELTRSATAEDGAIHAIVGREAGIKTVLETLFVETWGNRRDLLPSLFPAFAIICGNRHPGDTIIATKIEWGLLPKQ